MKRIGTIVWGVVLGLTAAAAVQQAQAQCAPARSFASAINGTTKQGFGQVGVDPTPVTPLGDELVRFWQSNDSTLGNNFSTACPASVAWKAATLPAGTHALSALVGGDCTANTCPDQTQNLTVVVEDWATGFPAPGINGDAFFVAWQVSPTPNLLRTWNFARTASTPGVTQTVYSYFRYPRANVTGSNRAGLNVEVILAFADVAPNFHGASGGGTAAGDIGSPLPATGTIVSYELMYHLGMTDPGRLRSLWTPIDTIPYPGAGVPGVFQSVSCLNPVDDAFLAVGITFDGGAGPDVPSQLVGRATLIECDPLLADPQQPLARPERKQAVGARPPGRR